MSDFQTKINDLNKGDRVYVGGQWYTVYQPATEMFHTVVVMETAASVWNVPREKISGVQFDRPTGVLTYWDR